MSKYSHSKTLRAVGLSAAIVGGVVMLAGIAVLVYSGDLLLTLNPLLGGTTNPWWGWLMLLVGFLMLVLGADTFSRP